MRTQWQPTLRYFWDFLVSQSLLLNPIFFIGMIWAMVGFWKFHRENPLWLYFFCMGAPLFLGYWLFSFHSRVLPNWPVAAVPSLFCLMAVYWDKKNWDDVRFVKPFFIFGLALGFFATAIMYDSNLIGKVTGQLLPGEKDPSRRVRAWKPTAEVVEDARAKLEDEGKSAFIIADDYSMTAELSFYIPQARAALKSTPLAYCVASDAPINQFYFWTQYDYRANRKGENAIYISELNPYPLEKNWWWKWLLREKVSYAEIPLPTKMPERVAAEFQSVIDLGEHEIKIGNRVFRRVHLWACYNLK
jgi:hypothetical protein